MIDEAKIHDLDAQQLRQVVRTLIAEAAGKDREIAFKQAFIDKLTHEMAVLKRLKFAAQSEAYNAEQKSLLEETIDTDLAALAAEIEQAQPSPQAKDDKQKPKRQPLPENLPRCDIQHEPENTTCGCDHLPLYRRESIFARAGLEIARSTLAQWVGQCGVQLQPLVDALRVELLKHSVSHADDTGGDAQAGALKGWQGPSCLSVELLHHDLQRNKGRGL